LALYTWRKSLNRFADIPPLRVATFNIQAGIGSRHLRHVLTHSFRYLLPHRQLLANLNLIAGQLKDFDIIALQESDSGSFRTRQIHQAQHIAYRTGMPYCYTQITRDVGRIASISLGLLCHDPCTRLLRHRLPASRHGRGLMEGVLHINNREIALFITHLSLKKSNRIRQMKFLAQRLNRYQSAILMGDLNCEPDASEFSYLLTHTSLEPPSDNPRTFPSWRPQRQLDYILATGDLTVKHLRTIPFICSDHLPVIAEIDIT